MRRIAHIVPGDQDIVPTDQHNVVRSQSSIAHFGDHNIVIDFLLLMSPLIRILFAHSRAYVIVMHGLWPGDRRNTPKHPHYATMCPGYAGTMCVHMATNDPQLMGETMGNKLQTIHYARISNDTRSECAVQRRRDAATANIQLRIMRKLVNFVTEFHADDLDQVLNSIDCLPSDWEELVATLNSD